MCVTQSEVIIALVGFRIRSRFIRSNIYKMKAWSSWNEIKGRFTQEKDFLVNLAGLNQKFFSPDFRCSLSRLRVAGWSLLVLCHLTHGQSAIITGKLIKTKNCCCCCTTHQRKNYRWPKEAEKETDKNIYSFKAIVIGLGRLWCYE